MHKKQILAQVTQAMHISQLGLALQKQLLGRHFLRSINYHGTPLTERDNFIEQLRFYKAHFDDVSLNDLNLFFREGCWHKEKPGLIISFDDGCYSNYEVAVPLLEEFGFTGWFFTPVDWIEAATAAREGRGEPHPKSDGPVMTWEDLKDLLHRPRPHVIGCHTASHHRLRASSSSDQLRAEIVDARFLMEERLGQEISIFCWVGGEEDTYSAAAAALIREAGYVYSFMTNNAPITARTSRLHLQRTNIETRDDLAVVQFQLSGVMDCLYTPKRRRVNRVTSA